MPPCYTMDTTRDDHTPYTEAMWAQSAEQCAYVRSLTPERRTRYEQIRADQIIADGYAETEEQMLQDQLDAIVQEAKEFKYG